MEVGHIIGIVLVATLATLMAIRSVLASRAATQQNNATATNPGAANPAPGNPPANNQPAQQTTMKRWLGRVTWFWTNIALIVMIFVIYLVLPTNWVNYLTPVFTGIIFTAVALSACTFVYYLFEKGAGAKRLAWMAVLVGFVWLGFKDPASTATNIDETMTAINVEGLQAVIPSVEGVTGVFRASPREQNRVEEVIWAPGSTYTLNPDQVLRGKLPVEGAVFDQPDGFCIRASAASGISPLLTPKGPSDNPWEEALVTPGPGDTNLVMTISAIRC